MDPLDMDHPELDLDTARRASIVQALRRTLDTRCPGSRTAPRGSLASGTADAYSDIDLLWTVPDRHFEECLAYVRAWLGEVAPVESVRADPDLQRSDRRRLLFVSFAGLPLFWRLDLDVRAESVGADDSYDLGNPAARGDDWSRSASALANGVAAVKALRRERPETARGLLERGLRRVGAPDAVTGRWAADIARLAHAAAQREPATAKLAGRVVRLAEVYLRG